MASISRRRRNSSAGWRKSGPLGPGLRDCSTTPGPMRRRAGDRPWRSSGGASWQPRIRSTPGGHWADGSAYRRRGSDGGTPACPVYEVLVQQELEAPPDREVVALADRSGAIGQPPAYAGLPSRQTRGRARRGGGCCGGGRCPVAEPVRRPQSGLLSPCPFPPKCSPGTGRGRAPDGTAASGRAARRAAVAVLAGLGIVATVALLRSRRPPQVSIGHISRITAQPGSKSIPRFRLMVSSWPMPRAPPGRCGSTSISSQAVAPLPSLRASAGTSTGRAGLPTVPG